MPIIAKNQLKIDRATCLNGKRTVYRVEDVPGLELDVSPTGSRTWRVRYQVGTGKARVERRKFVGDARAITLGDATKEALRIRAAVQLERRDPHAERKLGDTTTFGGLFDLWLEQHAKPNKKSWQADEDMYARHVKSRLGHRAVADLRKRDYIAALDEILEKAGGWQANRAQALITGVLNWAENDGKIEEHSAKGIPKRMRHEPSRERVLSHAELRAWWHALDTQASPRMARLLRVLLLTGCRLSEACGMESREIQGDLWEIPGERRKGGRAHCVPLSPLALSLITQAMSEEPDSPFVFPAYDRHRLMDKSVTRHAPDRAYAALCLELGFVDDDGKVNTGVHDLRRTQATELAKLGVPTELIERIQGRTGRKNVAGVYNRHEYLAERRDALERWERELLRIVGSNRA